VTLPEVDLDQLTVTEHEAHHVALHDLLNKLLVDADVGDQLTKTAADASVGSVGNIQPQYVWPNQQLEVSHTSAGPLTITLTRFIRAVRITATANITSLVVNGFDTLGDLFAMVNARIDATGTISVDLSGDPELFIANDPGSSLTDESAVSRIARWSEGS
jgi:hypothetical protein